MPFKNTFAQTVLNIEPKPIHLLFTKLIGKSIASKINYKY